MSGHTVVVSIHAYHFEIQDPDQFLIVSTLDRGPDRVSAQDFAIHWETLVVYSQETTTTFLEHFIKMYTESNNALHLNPPGLVVDLDCFSAVSSI
jgi:hypothetical protein